MTTSLLKDLTSVQHILLSEGQRVTWTEPLALGAKLSQSDSALLSVMEETQEAWEALEEFHPIKYYNVEWGRGRG